VTVYAKMAMPDLKRCPKNLYLLKYDLDVNDFVVLVDVTIHIFLSNMVSRVSSDNAFLA